MKAIHLPIFIDKKELKKWEQADETDKAFRIAADTITKEINKINQMKWPPDSADLYEDVTIGDNLKKFLKAIFSGNMERDSSELVSRIIRSMDKT